MVDNLGIVFDAHISGPSSQEREEPPASPTFGELPLRLKKKRRKNIRVVKKVFYESTKPQFIQGFEVDDNIFQLHASNENLDRLDSKRLKGETANCTDPIEKTIGEFKVPEPKSRWDSHTQHLAESQAIVTDTQMIEAMIMVEMPMTKESYLVHDKSDSVVAELAKALKENYGDEYSSKYSNALVEGLQRTEFDKSDQFLPSERGMSFVCNEDSLRMVKEMFSNPGLHAQTKTDTILVAGNQSATHSESCLDEVNNVTDYKIVSAYEHLTSQNRFLGEMKDIEERAYEQNYMVHTESGANRCAPSFPLEDITENHIDYKQLIGVSEDILRKEGAVNNFEQPVPEKEAVVINQLSRPFAVGFIKAGSRKAVKVSDESILKVKALNLLGNIDDSQKVPEEKMEAVKLCPTGTDKTSNASKRSLREGKLPKDLAAYDMSDCPVYKLNMGSPRVRKRGKFQKNSAKENSDYETLLMATGVVPTIQNAKKASPIEEDLTAELASESILLAKIFGAQSNNDDLNKMQTLIVPNGSADNLSVSSVAPAGYSGDTGESVLLKGARANDTMLSTADNVANIDDFTMSLIFEADTTVESASETNFGLNCKDNSIKPGNNTANPCEDSFSALLENEDWDEQIVPGCAVEASASDSKPRHDSDKIPDSEYRKYYLSQRQKAREEQKKMGAKNVRVRRLLGSLSWELMKNPLHLSQSDEIEPVACVPERQKDYGVKDFVFGIDAVNATDFRFYAPDFYSQSDCDENVDGFPVGDGFRLIFDDFNYAGVNEFERAFLAGEGVAPKLIPPGWLLNSYRLNVWQLAYDECNFGAVYAGKRLTPHDLMLRIKNQYDIEIDRNQIPALKRIYERDDAAGRPLVLNILKIDKEANGYCLMVSDGSYICVARGDPVMNDDIEAGELVVGSKIMSIGAELIGCREGVSPLEVPAGCYLKLSSNSIWKEAWHSELGFKQLSTAPLVPLKSIRVQGGSVCRVDVFILRVYPVVYMEKTEDGQYIMRNCRTEEKVAANFQQKLEYQLELMRNQLHREEISKNSVGNKCKSVTRVTAETLAQAKTPEDLFQLFENAADPSQVEKLLTDEQRGAIMSHQESLRASAQQVIAEKVKAARLVERNVSASLRAKVTGLSPDDDGIAIISWWQPSDDLRHALVEGKAMSLYNLTPGKNRNQLYMNSTRKSRYEELRIEPNFKWEQRKVIEICGITRDFRPVLDELDIVGLVVCNHQVVQGDYKLETVYLTDTGESFFGLIFTKGLEEFSFENMLTEGCVVTVSNVQWRKNSGSGAIPCGYVSATTVVSTNPKSVVLKNALDALKRDLEEEDIPSLIARCQDSITCQLERFRTEPSNRNVSFTKETSMLSRTIYEDIGMTSVFNNTMPEAVAAPSPANKILGNVCGPSGLSKTMPEMVSTDSPVTNAVAAVLSVNQTMGNMSGPPGLSKITSDIVPIASTVIKTVSNIAATPFGLSKSVPDFAAASSPRPQYLNGFALQPQAASTPIRPIRATAQARIDRLKLYGELSPMSPRLLRNSPSIAKKHGAPHMKQ